MRRIGHRANTPETLAAALDAGVDMLEFDVLPEHPDGSGALLLAHDYDDLARRAGSVLGLDEGLDALVGTGVDLDVDLKLGGYELRVLDALAARDAVERVLVSTMEETSLRLLRARAPELRLGLSVPRLRRDPLRSPLTALPALGVLQWYRRALPGRAVRALRAGPLDAIMANVHVVTPALVRAVTGAGAELYVWTVDDADRIRALDRLGVTGVITNDPRLFAPSRAQAGVG